MTSRVANKARTQIRNRPWFLSKLVISYYCSFTDLHFELHYIHMQWLMLQYLKLKNLINNALRFILIAYILPHITSETILQSNCGVTEWNWNFEKHVSIKTQHASTFEFKRCFVNNDLLQKRLIEKKNRCRTSWA